MTLKKILNPKSYISKFAYLYEQFEKNARNKKLCRKDSRKRIGFSGFFPESEQWKIGFIFNQFIPDFADYTINDYKPTIEYFSVFGERQDIKKSKAKVKIFWTGEDVENNFSSFRDNCVCDSDLSLGFTPPHKVLSSNYLRYPLWLLYYFGNLRTKDELKIAIDNFNSKQFDKTKFCSLVASHDTNGIRTKLIKCISPIEKVSSAGKFLHNDDSLINAFSISKEEYLKQFMFNICPENISVEGYTTEKIFQSFDAGCIPIYFGSANIPEKEVINPESYILLSDNSQNSNFDEVYDKVKTLWQSKSAYKDFMSKPRLLPSSVDFIYNLNQEVKSRIEGLIETKGRE